MTTSGPECASVPRLAGLTGQAPRQVRRHLDRLLELGLVQRLRQGRATRWTLAAVRFPGAVADPAAEDAYQEVHGRRLSPAGASSLEQRPLPFETGTLAIKLAAEPATDPGPDGPGGA